MISAPYILHAKNSQIILYYRAEVALNDDQRINIYIIFFRNTILKNEIF